MRIRRGLPAVLAAGAVALVAACGGGRWTTTNAERADQTINVWIFENQPVRARREGRHRGLHEEDGHQRAPSRAG